MSEFNRPDDRRWVRCSRFARPVLDAFSCQHPVLLTAAEARCVGTPVVLGDTGRRCLKRLVGRVLTVLAFDRLTHHVAGLLGKRAEAEAERGRFPHRAPWRVERHIRFPESARLQTRGGNGQQNDEEGVKDGGLPPIAGPDASVALTRLAAEHSPLAYRPAASIGKQPATG